ncbi:MAG: hypothetical protein ACYDDO_13915 [Acidiferrobacterales bacterium]
MLHWFRRKLKPVARGLLATVASLWVVIAVAPCAMAAPSHEMDHAAIPCPFNTGMAHMSANDCHTVTVMNCKLPNINSPITTALEHTVATPALLARLPVSMVLPDTAQHPRRDFLTPDVPAPPLHILHLTLII